jgi:hypothetical protein
VPGDEIGQWPEAGLADLITTDLARQLYVCRKTAHRLSVARSALVGRSACLLFDPESIRRHRSGDDPIVCGEPPVSVEDVKGHRGGQGVVENVAVLPRQLQC